MELQHINIKIPLDGELSIDLARVVETFHQWIRDGVIDELLIDVADYAHVPAGPGVLLIGHEADYCFDNTGDRWGLRYNRKAPLDGTNEDRFRQAFGAAAKACRLLETQLAVKFSRMELELFINDRALAPNTPATFAACEAEISAFAKNVVGCQDFTLKQDADPRHRFGVAIVACKPFDLSI